MTSFARFNFLSGTRLVLAACLLHAGLLLSVVAQADEAQDRFDEAMAALDADRVYEARQQLSQLISDHPTLYRARLELARANYLTRDYDAAEEQVLKVLEDPDVPASVRTTLLAFLAQIRDDRLTFKTPHHWGGYVYTALCMIRTSISVRRGMS